MTAARVAAITSALESEFEPEELLVKDQSHLHAGHAGAQSGKGHFSVKIVSQKFDSLTAIQRHQAVYAALGPLIESDIHALQIRAFSPAETPKSGGE